MTITDPNAVRDEVRKTYGKIAGSLQTGCCSDTSSCCNSERPAATAADKLGYSTEEIAAVSEGADLGLGCGNPQAIASLKPGETVLDLGSGAGFDCFLAARSVGSSGQVLGVDMTPEMVAKARANAAKAGVTNVEFRFGEIEALPVAANSVDVIISNCVINLSPDKLRVFREAFRVLNREAVLLSRTSCEPPNCPRNYPPTSSRNAPAYRARRALRNWKPCCAKRALRTFASARRTLAANSSAVGFQAGTPLITLSPRRLKP